MRIQRVTLYTITIARGHRPKPCSSRSRQLPISLVHIKDLYIRRLFNRMSYFDMPSHSNFQAVRSLRLISRRAWDPFIKAVRHSKNPNSSMQVTLRHVHQANLREKTISRRLYYTATLLSHHEGFFRYLQSKPYQYSQMSAEQQAQYIARLRKLFMPLHAECSGCARRNTDATNHFHTLVALNEIAGQGFCRLRLNHQDLFWVYRTDDHSLIWTKLKDTKEILKVGGCRVASVTQSTSNRSKAVSHKGTGQKMSTTKRKS